MTEKNQDVELRVWGFDNATADAEEATHACAVQQRLEYGIYKTVNMAHSRQSQPDYGLGFQGTVLKRFNVSPLRPDANNYCSEM